jgi:hypothetical protein
VGWLEDVHGKTVVGIGAGTQTNAEHGWFSTGDSPGHLELIHDPRVGTPFTPAPVTDAQRAVIEANLAAHGLSPAALDANRLAAYQSGLARMAADPDVTPEMAAHWYQYEHDSAIAYADHNQSAYVCFAEVAATTSKAQWSMQTGVSSVYGEAITVYPNLTAAATVAAFGIENPTITLTQADCDAINIVTTSYFDPGTKADGSPATPMTAIDPTLFANESHPELLQPLVPGEYQANQLSDQQLGKYVDMSGNGLLPGVPIGLPDGLARGIAIARGADPADVLNGEKQLSFTTNGAFPELNTATTNDTHIGAEMLAGAVYPPDDKGGRGGQPMSSTDLAAYVQQFYGAASGAGYRYITESIMAGAAAEDPPVLGHQYQAVMWVGDPTIAAASTKGVHGDVLKASKLDVQFPWRPYAPDDEPRLDKVVALQAPITDLAKKCVVTAANYAHPPWPKDQRHAARPKWLKDRIARGDFKKFELPAWFKGFGDPGSTQERQPNGTFGAGTGTWKPTMTPAEGHAWVAARGSKYQNTVVHITSVDAVDGIRGQGFHTSQYNIAHEAGVYFATDPDGASQYELRGSQAVSAVVDTQNPLMLTFDASTVDADDADESTFRAAALTAAGLDPEAVDEDATHDTFGDVIAEDPVLTTAALKSAGYDAVIVSSPSTTTGAGHEVGGNQIIAFDPQQVVVIGTTPITEPQLQYIRGGGARFDAPDNIQALQTAFGKGFGDPGSTQSQDAHGRFTTGSGTSSLEAKAIAHFGAAEELQGQQFITPNGTILNLEGDGHDRIKEVVGGNVATATSRALDAGFLRTSLDTVQGGDLGLVMELTQPMTSQQIASVRQGISDAGGIGYIAVDVANTGGYNRVTGAGGGLLYSQDQEQPTSTQITTIIRDANVAAGAPVNAAAFAELLKGFGDPGSTQTQDAGGHFTQGSGLSQANYSRFSPNGEEGNRAVAQLIDTGVAGGMSVMPEFLKHQVVIELSARSGLSYDRTNELVATWAASSSDTQPDSVALQMAVAQQFGVTPTPFIQKSADEMAQFGMPLAQVGPNGTSLATWDSRMSDATAVVAAQYAYTQETLAAQGVVEVTAYRGVGFPDLPNPVTTGPAATAYDLNEANTAAYQFAANNNVVPAALDQNPLSSWSTSSSTASDFARNQAATVNFEGMGLDALGADTNGHPYMLTTSIPADRILSTAATGVGCQNESEITVIGGTGNQFGTVHVTSLKA